MGNKFKVIGAGLLVLSFLTVVGIWTMTRPPKLGGDFTLNHQGQDWNLVKNSKKLNVLYIGYAQCPDVCPMSLSIASQAFRQLNEKDLTKTQLIFLSVDYEHDTPETVDQYAKQFFSSFLGMTGSKEQIDFTVSQMKASYAVQKNVDSYLGYSIAHTDRLYFLDKKGMILDSVPSPRDYKLVLQKIKENL